MSNRLAPWQPDNAYVQKAAEDKPKQRTEDQFDGQHRPEYTGSRFQPLLGPERVNRQNNEFTGRNENHGPACAGVSCWVGLLAKGVITSRYIALRTAQDLE
jgi:hypothetical protein